MTRLYIAGPMSGIDLFNFPEFFRAALSLRALGYSVVNPAEHDMASGLDPSFSLEEQGLNYDDLIEVDLELIRECSGIALLPGWESSPGVQRELAFAGKRGIRSLPLDQWLEDRRVPSHV